MGRVTFRISRSLERLLDGSAFRNFAAVNNSAIAKSADMAQQVTRQTFASKQIGAGDTPDRPTRRTTHGQFADSLNWDYKTAQGISVVFFDWEEINSVAGPYWLVQEVGTNRTFDIIGGESTVFPAGALQGGRIRGQVGRTIPFGLQWGIGGVYVPPGRKDGAVLTPLAQLTVADEHVGKIGRIKIRREIEGKHFIRAGAQAGFQFYRNVIVDEYRRVFQ